MKFGALATMAFLLFFGLALASLPGTGTAGLAPDDDSDGVPNVLDNCTLVKNVSPGPPGGCDKDQDGYGNMCDGDFNEDGAVDGVDFGLFKTDFKAGKDGGKGTDHNCDTAVDGVDFGIFKGLFKTGKNGASGLSCANPTKAGGCANSQ